MKWNEMKSKKEIWKEIKIEKEKEKKRKEERKMCDSFIKIVCKGGVEFVMDKTSASQSRYLKRKIEEGKWNHFEHK